MVGAVPLRKADARTWGQDLMHGEHVVGGGRVNERPTGLGGTLMKSLSSHPRYYEQKTAAEAKIGRALTPDEFERDHWRTPDSDIISGTSIFDPVLCELAFRWFSPLGGLVLDPFAGGSVRGIVASKLGRRYVGVDLRPEQVEANREQAAAICADPMPLWHVGDSLDIARHVGDDLAADFIFSCPPYADLERYSDDPADLSNMDYADFIAAYRAIIARAVGLLKPNRFACFVVGDVRDRKGFYRAFPWHTVEAFQAAGCHLYNEAALVTAVGSLPIRILRQFDGARKLGKTHQNVLVFCKGDPRLATKACGVVDFTVPPGIEVPLLEAVNAADGDTITVPVEWVRDLLAYVRELEGDDDPPVAAQFGEPL
jgi:DNA modification methylase